VKAGIDRARANGVRVGRKPTPPKVEAAIREKLKAGIGMLKIAAECRVGSGVVQRIKREMLAEAAT
jgi:DNA invertase Pin-like site-specific DNA recombinase